MSAAHPLPYAWARAHGVLLHVDRGERWLIVDLEQSDVDSLNGEYGVPGMFQTVNTFTCLAPVRVGGNVDAISSVISRSIDG